MGNGGHWVGILQMGRTRNVSGILVGKYPERLRDVVRRIMLLCFGNIGFDYMNWIRTELAELNLRLLQIAGHK